MNGSVDVTGAVTVVFSELPIRAWHHLSNEEKRQLGVSNGAGVSVSAQSERSISDGSSWEPSGERITMTGGGARSASIRFSTRLRDHAYQAANPPPGLPARDPDAGPRESGEGPERPGPAVARPGPRRGTHRRGRENRLRKDQFLASSEAQFPCRTGGSRGEPREAPPFTSRCAKP